MEKILMNESVKSILTELSMEVLNRIDKGEIKKPYPISISTLNRALSGKNIDEKSIRTIACMY